MSNRNSTNNHLDDEDEDYDQLDTIDNNINDDMSDNDDNDDTDGHEIVAPLFRSMQLAPMETALIRPNQSPESRYFEGSKALQTRLGPIEDTKKLHLTREHDNESIWRRASSNIDNDSIYEPTGWKNPILTRIGSFNSISKYHVEADLKYFNQIRNGLMEIFRTYSLEVSYQESPIVTARCRALLEKLEFNVLVWRSRTPNKLIVEVDRVSGDAIPFHSFYAGLILQTVKDCATTPPMELPKPVSEDPIIRGTTDSAKVEFEITASLLNQCIQTGALPEHALPDDLLRSALELVIEMLCSDCYEIRGTALRSLAQLTDPYTSGNITATTVSQVVLLGTAKKQGYEKLSLIRDNVLRLAFVGRCIDDVNTEEELREHSFTALSIVAQAINFVEDGSDLTFFVDFTRSILTLDVGSLSDVLLRKMQGANQEPHAAYLATHILAALCRYRLPEVCSKVKYHSDYIQHAHRIGCVRHAALEKACERLLLALYPRV